jgi:hypothetical protein
VTVTAGAADAQSSLSAKFTIGFGHVDVSAEPRSQAPGKKVRLWVHAAAHSRVVLSVGLGGKPMVRFRGTTGPKGWLHHAYRVGTSPRFSSGATVRVIAVARTGGRSWHTATTFQIR